MVKEVPFVRHPNPLMIDKVRILILSRNLLTGISLTSIFSAYPVLKCITIASNSQSLSIDLDLSQNQIQTLSNN